jgi:hypothetical protein
VAKVACALSALPRVCAQRAWLYSSVAISLFQSRAAGVAHVHNCRVLRLLIVSPASLYVSVAGLPAIGVGHEPEPVSDVERADARSRDTTRPDGVTFSFQVIAKTVEPSVSNRALNLFAKDDDRAALAYEPKPRRPKVARIGAASLGASTRERLTGATSGPALSVVRPSGEPQGVAPSPNPGEEMALSESSKVGWLYVNDAPGIDFAISNQPLSD